ncbi:hypothetical protein P4O66_012687, partial [Electrophorus voltai]
MERKRKDEEVLWLLKSEAVICLEKATESLNHLLASLMLERAPVCTALICLSHLWQETRLEAPNATLEHVKIACDLLESNSPPRREKEDTGHCRQPESQRLITPSAQTPQSLHRIQRGWGPEAAMSAVAPAEEDTGDLE